MADELESLLSLEQMTRRDSGTSKVRIIRNHETGGIALIPYKATSLEEFEKEALAMHAAQRPVPLAPIDPGAVDTMGGQPIPDYGKASGRKKDEPARSSSSLKIVR